MDRCWGSSCRSTPSGWEERCGDAGDALPQEVDENREGVKLALATGSEQRGQDLLRVRPEPRAIAARDFPIDDGRAEGLFRAPVCCVDRRVVQETEERRPLAVEMCCESSHGGRRGGVVEDRGQTRREMAARHCYAVGGDRAGRVPVPHLQRLLQDRVYLSREGRAGMIGLQLATAAEQMGGMPMSAYRPVCQLPEYADPAVSR